MSNIIKTLLTPVHTELDRFQRTATAWDVGALKAKCAKSPPFILWVYKGGATEPLDELERGFWQAHRARFDVEIWARDEDRTGDGSLALFLNLQLAAHRVFAQRISWGAHVSAENEDPGLDYRGSLIKTTAEIEFSVSDQPQQVPGYPTPLDGYAERPMLSGTNTAEIVDNLDE